MVVSQVRTIEGVRINFQTNSLTNNNVKPKQVILKMTEVALQGALNHPKMPGDHRSLEIVEMAVAIKVGNRNTSRRSNTMKTIKILSQMVTRR